VSRPSNARPLSFDEDPWTFIAAVGLGSLLSAGALLWLSAMATLGLTGSGWHVHRSASMGSFLASILAGTTPRQAWHVAGGRGALEPAWLFWLMAALLACTVALLVVLALRVLSRRTTPGTEARWATARDERVMAVPDAPESRPHRLVAGRSKRTGRCIAGEDCVSAVAFGPNGSGKTVGLIIPNVLEWQGSVVMTTAKPQDLGPVLARRAALGPVWVVAPGGAPGVRTAAWSPVEYATDADAADRMAEWLVDSSGMTGDPKARPWNAQARKYLKGLLLAARLSGRGISGFIEWAYEGELGRDQVEQILTDHGFLEALREYRSTWRIHEEGKGSVMFTAFGLADTYNRPSVIASAARSDFTPGHFFGERPATLLLVTPQSEVDRFTPYFTALISSIVHEAEQEAARVGGPVSPRLLLALDEAGNVFRYPRLPHLLTTGRGNGVQLLLAYHDIAQLEHLFGGRDVARTVVSNAKMRILLPGVGDLETLRYFSDLLGQTRISMGSSQTGPDGRRSRSEAEQREALAPLHLLQQMPDGEAVVLYQNVPPAKVKLRRWFAERDLRNLAAADADDQQPKVPIQMEALR
jgi:type IV secretory pathway TraG/TraD family ATPase VirD4